MGIRPHYTPLSELLRHTHRDGQQFNLRQQLQTGCVFGTGFDMSMGLAVSGHAPASNPACVSSMSRLQETGILRIAGVLPSGFRLFLFGLGA